MFACTFFDGRTALATRRLPALPPIGYEVCFDRHLDTIYYVEGGRCFVEESGEDIRTEVYVCPSLDAARMDQAMDEDQRCPQSLEELAARPWRPIKEI